MIRDIVTVLLKLGAAFCAGVLVVAVIIVLAATASGQEAVPTREAASGEQDKSLNYRPKEGLHESKGDRAVREIQRAVETADKSCEAGNAMRLEMLRMIAREVTNNPEHMSIYRDTIKIIYATWCHDDE